MLWSTVSNALARSKKMQQEMSLFLIALVRGRRQLLFVTHRGLRP